MTKIKVEWEAFKNGHRYDVITMETVEWVVVFH